MPTGRREPGEKAYFTHDRARAAQAYLDEVLYGGPTGLAYLQSVARFVESSSTGNVPRTALSITHTLAPDVQMNDKLAVKVEEGADKMEVDGSPEPARMEFPLGMTLAAYTEVQVADRVTGGAHRLLMLLSNHLATGSHPRPLAVPSPAGPDAPIFPFSQQSTPSLLGKFAHASAHVLPTLWSAFRELDNNAPLDLAGLIKDAKELFVAEEVWAGRTAATGTAGGSLDATVSVGGEAEALLRAMKHVGALLGKVAERQATGDLPTAKPTPGADTKAITKKAKNGDVNKDNGDEDVAMRGPEEEEEESDAERERGTVDASASSSTQLSSVLPASATTAEPTPTSVQATTDGEDPLLREVRLNLIALAKRAPLDRIAPMPAHLVQLVPAHLRAGIPTRR